ncbi:hypothetical protein C8R43DRAFT_1034058 [Mycena crocata]|nr:hypothetical protein C8R43DRAFT_1034058 [Mycena crocata]
MKTFQNVVSAAVGLSALSLVNAAAISDSAVLTSSLASATATASGSVGISTTDTALPTTTATGGFVVAGIYTTCLTLTFAAPIATGTPTFTDTVIDPTASASSAPTVTSLSASVLSPPIPIASGSASFSAFPSSGPIIVRHTPLFTTTCPMLTLDHYSLSHPRLCSRPVSRSSRRQLLLAPRTLSPPSAPLVPISGR